MTANTFADATRPESGFAYPDAGVETYLPNKPFPHAVFKGCWNADLLTACKREIADVVQWDGEKDFFGARRKRRFRGTLGFLPPSVKRVILEADSPGFLR